MPTRTVRHVVAITNGQGEESHLKISLELELNINLNSNGIEATVSAKDISAKPIDKEEEGFGGFVVPQFENTTEKIDFGKKVDSEQARTIEQVVARNKNRTRKEEN